MLINIEPMDVYIAAAIFFTINGIFYAFGQWLFNRHLQKKVVKLERMVISLKRSVRGHR